MALLVTTALALASAAGCARQAPASPEPVAAPLRGKPSAPVAIDAHVADGTAQVTIRFEADAKDVRIDVHGAGGLAVTGVARPVGRASFAHGESATFDVTYAPGPGRSHLVVGVRGKFHGAGRRTAVASFAVGDPTPEQLDAGGTVVEGADGERLKVVVPGR